MAIDTARPTAAAELAEFVVGLQFSDLPPDVVLAAKRGLLDTLGASILGATTEEGMRVAAAVKDLDRSDETTIWGSNLRAAPNAAALVNGTTAHSRELDDFGGCGHSGAVVVPAAVTVAEAIKGTDGQGLLTAIVAGYELASRATEAAGGYQEHNARGWHSTGTCGSFGAAASSAKLLGLDREHTTWAIGLSGSFTGGLWGFLVDGAMSKRLHPGKAAETGVMAAYLARRDFTGPAHIFEAEWGGFLSTYSPEVNDLALLTDRLGEEFRILRTGFKPYASCRGVHSSVDSLFKLRAEHEFTADDVEQIVVTSHPIPMQMVGHSTVDTMLEAQMSLPYGLSVALLSGDASLAQYSPDRIGSAEVRDVLSRIKIVIDPSLPSTQQATVEVRTKDGRSYRHRTDIALGAAENPLSDEALTDKFRVLTGMVFPEDQVEQLVNTIWHIEELDHLDPLWPLLARS